MVEGPRIYTAKVMHQRMFPEKNAFSYSVPYLALPLPAAPIPGRLIGFHAQDLGLRDGTDPLPWARAILSDYGLNAICRNIILVTMPRILGYVFNPVSFYLCLDDAGKLRAVLCEVHNTFGEQHTYLCARPDHAPIMAEQWLEAAKVFHVSPFLERSGTYRFRFDLRSESLGIWIDFYDKHQQKQLLTSLIGHFTPLDAVSLRRTFWRHPPVALKAIWLIHWQALRLILKGIRHIAKPDQMKTKISATRDLNKIANLNKM